MAHRHGQTHMIQGRELLGLRNEVIILSVHVHTAEVGCSCDESGRDSQRGHRAVSAVGFNNAFNILYRKVWLAEIKTELVFA